MRASRLWGFGWGGRWRKQQRGPDCGDSGQGTRGAHVKHDRHARDAGRVEAQWLVERGRGLSSRKGNHRRRGDMRKHAGGWDGVVGGASGREAPTVEAQGRARAERTLNMFTMSVTLDVSRLSGWLNADARCRVERESIGGGRHDMRASRRKGGVGWSGGASSREAPTAEAQGTRGAHVKHVPHVCDA